MDRYPVMGPQRGEQADGEVQIVLNQTPFYAESGGQVGDAGLLVTETGKAQITDTKKVTGLYVHFAKVTEGVIRKGQGAELRVDPARRADIQANHSATHLLNEALREVLGDHIAQRGSLNAPDRLRFDFSHTKAMSTDELTRVERDVNAIIRQNSRVETRIMTPDDARALGAQALFGEKYGEEVRVVGMGHDPAATEKHGVYSLELCGGTHVRRTGDIGLLRIVAESGVASGVRRIEGITGSVALAAIDRADQHLAAVCDVVKGNSDNVVIGEPALAVGAPGIQSLTPTNRSDPWIDFGLHQTADQIVGHGGEVAA
mgnify:CR=1 FL=1